MMKQVQSSVKTTVATLSTGEKPFSQFVESAIRRIPAVTAQNKNLSNSRERAQSARSVLIQIVQFEAMPSHCEKESS